MATELGPYSLLARLATGGMAEIHLARQRGEQGFARVVVLKRILPELAHRDDVVRMFLNEAGLAAGLEHPNIVRIFDLGRSDDSYFLAMEYLDGEDLRSLARQVDATGMALPPEHTCHILCEAAAGLHYAHTRTGPEGRPLGLVHRDISPQNLVVTFDGRVKIIDFGVAKATAMAAETLAGLIKGKYAYMSPEQCRGQRIDARADVWSLGVLLWELLAWRRLFRRENEFATLRAVVEEPIPSPRTVRSEIPADVEAVCLRALARDLDQRTATAQAFGDQLAACIRVHGWTTGPQALSTWMRELFAPKLAKQRAALAQRGASSVEELLLRVEDLSEIAWLEGSPMASTGGWLRAPLSQRELAHRQGTPSRLRALARPRLFTEGRANAVPAAREPRWRTLGAGASLIMAATLGGVYLHRAARQAPGRAPAAVVSGPSEASATLRISVDPPDATVFLDGQRKSGVTPFVLENVPVGPPHRLRILRQGRREESAEIRDLRPGEVRQLRYSLAPE